MVLRFSRGRVGSRLFKVRLTRSDLFLCLAANGARRWDPELVGLHLGNCLCLGSVF